MSSDRDELIARLREASDPAVVTVGTFDGVHCGHRALVGATRRLARSRGPSVTAVTFSPRPEILFPPASLPDACR